MAAINPDILEAQNLVKLTNITDSVSKEEMFQMINHLKAESLVTSFEELTQMIGLLPMLEDTNSADFFVKKNALDHLNIPEMIPKIKKMCNPKVVTLAKMAKTYFLQNGVGLTMQNADLQTWEMGEPPRLRGWRRDDHLEELKKPDLPDLDRVKILDDQKKDEIQENRILKLVNDVIEACRDMEAFVLTWKSPDSGDTAMKYHIPISKEHWDVTRKMLSEIFIALTDSIYEETDPDAIKKIEISPLGDIDPASIRTIDDLQRDAIEYSEQEIKIRV
jgi:hypothetical protein